MDEWTRQRRVGRFQQLLAKPTADLRAMATLAQGYPPKPGLDKQQVAVIVLDAEFPGDAR